MLTALAGRFYFLVGLTISLAIDSTVSIRDKIAVNLLKWFFVKGAKQLLKILYS